MQYPTVRINAGVLVILAITIATATGCQSETEKYYSENPDRAISVARECSDRFNANTKEVCDAATTVAHKHFSRYFKTKVETFKEMSWDQLARTRCSNAGIGGIDNSSDCDAKEAASKEKLVPVVNNLQQMSKAELNKQIRKCDELNYSYSSNSAEENAICSAVGEVYEERYIAEHKDELDAFNKKVETYAAMDALAFSDKKQNACGKPNSRLTQANIFSAQTQRFDLSECSAVVKAEEKRK